MNGRLREGVVEKRVSGCLLTASAPLRPIWVRNRESCREKQGLTPAERALTAPLTSDMGFGRHGEGDVCVN